MDALQDAELLTVWERGCAASATARGLLLLAIALDDRPASLASASVGHRDAWLLTLRERLFGDAIECLASCAACGERIEVAFTVDAVRAPHALPGRTCQAVIDGVARRFRVPTSADLLAIERLDASVAERALFDRCEVDAAPDVAVLDASGRALVASAMSRADGQAEVLLDVVCPACGHAGREVFDIVAHLWAELDHWARATLARVHALASRYGWSEAAILRLSKPRRRAYLDLIGAA